MSDADIIAALREKMATPVGRHLYAVLGDYAGLARFADSLRQARTPDGIPFPVALSVNRGILKTIPDEEFRRLTEDEARRPPSAVTAVGRALDAFLRGALEGSPVLVLRGLEMLIVYQIDFAPFRSLATDARRIVLLLPGRRERDTIVLFEEADGVSHRLPANLIAENHVWQLGPR